jgi:hypothetical protein
MAGKSSWYVDYINERMTLGHPQRTDIQGVKHDTSYENDVLVEHPVPNT